LATEAADTTRLDFLVALRYTADNQPARRPRRVGRDALWIVWWMDGFRGCLMSDARPLPPLGRLYLWATHRLYNEFAWSYDLAAWLVSTGRWDRWRRMALELASVTVHKTPEITRRQKGLDQP